MPRDLSHMTTMELLRFRVDIEQDLEWLRTFASRGNEKFNGVPVDQCISKHSTALNEIRTELAKRSIHAS